jgi:hypothetical protein
MDLLQNYIECLVPPTDLLPQLVEVCSFRFSEVVPVHRNDSYACTLPCSTCVNCASYIVMDD